MSFISLEFFAFAPIVISLYFVLGSRLRWLLLLISSYLFYVIGNGVYVIILIFSTITDYWISHHLVKVEHPTYRKLLVLLSLFLNLGVLFYFKYANFFISEVNTWANTLNLDISLPTLNIILPIGISFYTFQALSYTIDVYRHKIEPEPHLGIFATFIVFFPQLVAGPIERASNLLPQLHQVFDYNEDRIVSGLRLILWGVFKKIVIADHLAIYVNTVYATPEIFSGQMLIAATLFFTFQIYCDFSGYSDIAIGIARILGIHLMTNFRQPYFALSLRDFWRRWHISLSQWFRDYVYIPLGGNRVSLVRNLLNLMTVFVISGLWHGASWTFIIWGAIHGVFVVIETLLTPHNNNEDETTESHLQIMWRFTITMIVVIVAWVFFRAETVTDAVYILTHFHHIDWTTLNLIGDGFSSTDGINNILKFMNPLKWSFTRLQFVWSLLLIGILLVVDFLQMRYGMTTLFNRLPAFVRWSLYNVVLLIIVLFGSWGSQQFIYFQF